MAACADIKQTWFFASDQTDLGLECVTGGQLIKQQLEEQRTALGILVADFQTIHVIMVEIKLDIFLEVVK